MWARAHRPPDDTPGCAGSFRSVKRQLAGFRGAGNHVAGFQLAENRMAGNHVTGFQLAENGGPEIM